METEKKPKAGEAAQAGFAAARDWSLADLSPVLAALQGLRFGSVELFIQDYRLMQIDRKEKIRSFKN
jgi:hypothetical protein